MWCVMHPHIKSFRSALAASRDDRLVHEQFLVEEEKYFSISDYLLPGLKLLI